MQQNHIGIDGLVVMWATTRSSHEKLLGGLTAIGLRTLAPEPIGLHRAVELSLKDLYATGRTKIRPLEGGIGYAVVAETATAWEVTGATDICVRVHESGAGGHIDVYPDRDRAAIVAAVDRVRNDLTADDVSATLTRVALYLGGVRLKPGVYWIEERNAPEWAKVAQVVEAASMGTPPTTVYAVAIQATAGAIRLVADAARAEAEEVLAEIQTDLARGMTPRGLKARKGKLEELAVRYGEFETKLGGAMEGIGAAMDAIYQQLTEAIEAEQGAARAARVA